MKKWIGLTLGALLFTLPTTDSFAGQSKTEGSINNKKVASNGVYCATGNTYTEKSTIDEAKNGIPTINNPTEKTIPQIFSNFGCLSATFPPRK